MLTPITLGIIICLVGIVVAIGILFIWNILLYHETKELFEIVQLLIRQQKNLAKACTHLLGEEINERKEKTQ